MACRERLLTLAVLALAPGLVAAGRQAGHPDRVQTLFAEGRLGAALEEASRLEDALLAAEWRCYLLLAGGDVPAALKAALEGLSLRPGHRGLLVNAITCALTLDLPDIALEHAAQLDLALREAEDEPSAAEVERAQRLLTAARALDRVGASGESSLALARVVVGAVLSIVVGGMLALALRPASVPSQATQNRFSTPPDP